MKKMVFIKVFILIGIFSLSKTQSLFMPNLPMGEYRIVYRIVYPCRLISNQSLQMNIYLSKKTLNITELKGNLTFLIPFDNALTYEFTVATWGSTGGWIPNSNFYKSKNACSSLKFILGNIWNSLVKGFNIPTSSCPIPAGTYITSGIDIKKLVDGNFSKLGYYGKFKAEAKARNAENKVLGCITAELNIIRPWEKPID